MNEKTCKKMCLCHGQAQARCNFASETRGKPLKKKKVMKNTDYDLERLASMISSESSLNALLEMMGEMGLEISDVARTA